MFIHQIGVAGFCMGGALSLAAAADLGSDVVAASAPFYGIPNQTKFNLESIKIPVQAHFGKRDHVKGFSSPDVSIEHLK